MATLANLAQEEFVSLTTYRRSGAAVSVPVWIAPATDASGGLLVTTTEPSGKVKRLRHDTAATAADSSVVAMFCRHTSVTSG